VEKLVSQHWIGTLGDLGDISTVIGLGHPPKNSTKSSVSFLGRAFADGLLFNDTYSIQYDVNLNQDPNFVPTTHLTLGGI